MPPTYRHRDSGVGVRVKSPASGHRDSSGMVRLRVRVRVRVRVSVRVMVRVRVTVTVTGGEFISNESVTECHGTNHHALCLHCGAPCSMPASIASDRGT